jgi:hypothetical protein
MTQFARRTAQPYRFLGRTIVAFNVLVFLAFLGLMLLRLRLQQPNCPDVTVRSVDGVLAKVAGACKAGGWAVTFGTSIIDNLAAGLIVAAVTSLLLWFISPKAQVEEDVASLASWNIHEVLHAPLTDTKNYWFRGRSGRFMRSTVMPALFEAGRRESQLRQFFMLLPDPAETSTLAAYAHYRNSLASETRVWDVSKIQVEIIATILAAAYYSNSSHFFSTKVYLKSDFALFRLDMSDNQLVMTREDPKWPAIICSGRSKFYASYHEEFRNEAENAKELDVSKAQVPADPDRADINQLVAALGIPLSLSDADSDAVIDAMKRPKLPYA